MKLKNIFALAAIVMRYCEIHYSGNILGFKQTLLRIRYYCPIKLHSFSLKTLSANLQ